MSYGQSVSWHVSHTKKLQAFDAKFRGLQGPNQAFPLWGDKPRGGAYWTKLEQQALRAKLEEISEASQYYQDKPFWMFAELAWIHGRSAVAIEDQLKKILGARAFYDRFPQY